MTVHRAVIGRRSLMAIIDGARSRLSVSMALTAGLAFVLTGCAYSDLKAPCARDEGIPAASFAELPREPEPFVSIASCGALKPLNKGEILDRDNGGLHRGE